MRRKFYLMKIEILRPKQVMNMLIKKTRTYLKTGRGVINPYIPLYNILMEKDEWSRLALFIKFMSTIGMPVPVPASISEEYSNIMLNMLARLSSNPFIEYTTRKVSTSQLPREDRELIEEYYTVKRRVWKPLVSRGDLVEEGKSIVIKGKHADYLLQRRRDIIKGISLSLGFLRLVERLVVPRRWTVETLSRDMYGDRWRGSMRRVAFMMSIMREYRMIKFSMRRGTWVLNMTREELISLLEALHLKRVRMVDRIMSRLLYVLLREEGMSHYQAMREVYPHWSGLYSEGKWLEKAFPVRISPVYVDELVEKGYLSEYELELAREYGILN